MTAPTEADLARLEQMEDFFQNASVGFLITNRDSGALTYNRAFGLLTGWPWPEEPGGRVFQPVLADTGDSADVPARLSSGDAVGDLVVAVHDLAGTPQRCVVNASACHDDGQLSAVRWTLRPELRHAIPSIIDDPSEYLNLPDDVVHTNDAARWAADLGVDTDVRPVVRAMTPQRTVERRAVLEDFFQHVPAAVHLIGLRGTVLRANQTDIAVAGYSDTPDDYIGSHVRQVYEDQTLMEDLFGRWDEGRPILNFQARLVSKDGVRLPVVIFSNSRLLGGEFQNTRCIVFPDTDPDAKPTPTRRFSWPSD